MKHTSNPSNREAKTQEFLEPGSQLVLLNCWAPEVVRNTASKNKVEGQAEVAQWEKDPAAKPANLSWR